MRKLADKMIEKISSPMQTPANKAEPKMSIKVSRAKTTIMDSDYWTVETIRSKAGLGDVSVAPRRFKPYGSPNRIYEIHVDNGEVGTAIREYPDTFKGGWKEQFTLGAGSSVSVAFDGYWEKYRGLWRLVTTGKPWISWVDSSGILWSQLWDDESTRMQLTEDVKHVRMIRAWKNKVIQQNDQGVVVAYIKNDGTVFYRSYCQQEDYSYMWENETALVDFTATAVSLNLFITIDYRMGFVLEDTAGRIHWLVTNRNWGGMASPSDHITAGITDLTFEVTPIAIKDTVAAEHLTTGIEIERFYVCPADVSPEILNIERLSYADKKTIELTFNYELECDLLNLKQALSVKNTVNNIYDIESVTQTGKVLTITTVDEMPLSVDITVTYRVVDSYYLAFRITDSCLYNSNAISLTIKGVPPVGFIEEKLTAGITNLTFGVMQVYYTDRFEAEQIEAGIADIMFAVTKVGSNPL